MDTGNTGRGRSTGRRTGGLNFGRLIIAAGLAGSLMAVEAFPLALTYSALATQTRQGRRDPKRTSTEANQPASPQDLLARARAAATQREKIELLERVLVAQSAGPAETEARDLLMREYALRGEQHLREGSPELAMKDFKSVFRVAPADISGRVFEQFVFPLPIAMNAFGYRTESVDLMKSFEPRFTNDINRLVQIGFFYVQIEAPIEAVRVLEKAVALAPDDHRAHNSLGTAYLINLRLDDAATEFERALQINPRDEFANLNLANIARAVGNYDRAVNFYRKQIELKSDDAEAHGGLAIALLALGRDEEADREIKRATKLAPGDHRFMTQLAYFYTSRKKPALARPLIERAAVVDPRYAWAHITKANIDLLESRYGDALATMINAQTLGAFPTLTFEVAKMLMALDGYDQAIEVMNRAITVTEDGEFETLLGGVARGRSVRLDLLLERERRAALFLNEHPTTSLQYRLAEALGRIDRFLQTAVAARKRTAPPARRRPSTARAGSDAAVDDDSLKTATRPRRTSVGTAASAPLSAGKDASLPGVADLMKAIEVFTTLDDGRQAFRMVWVSRKLTDSGIALDAAEGLARRALAVADSATGPEGSMRDAPLLDREGRRAVFLGRAHDALGWALYKKGDLRGAIDHLSQSVQFYPPSAERKTAVWHLATVTEEAGETRRALDLYIASYDASNPTAAVRRSQIESLYKKVNGSLAGLDEKLKNQ